MRASIVIPTRGRPWYLEGTLGAVMSQARRADAEVVVVNDGGDPATAALAERWQAKLVSLPDPRGLNSARNRGIKACGGEVIVLIDDDAEPAAGWLSALLARARAPDAPEVLGGPIVARLEGGGPRACGREPPPITTLDLGPDDLDDAPLVWGANMAIRRQAFNRVGFFDETIQGRGDEEEWELRHRRAGGRIGYVANALVIHRRLARDATIRALARDAYRLGRTARHNDVRKGCAPPAAYELRTLLGCGWHTLRRRCGYGIVMGAHAAGRVRALVQEQGQ